MGDNWIWGNSKGGCGAPLRDSEGNVITNLKAVVKSGGINSPVNNNKPRRPAHYEEEEEERFHGARDRRGYDRDDRDDRRRDRDRDRERERDRGYHESPRGSPVKGRGSEITSGVSNDERMERQRRAAEYQEQLKRQIEEKNRKKEMEKRKEDEEKRRDLEMYMNSIRPSPKQQQAAQAAKKKPLFKAESEDEDFDRERDRDRRRDRNGDRDREGYRGREEDDRGRYEPPRERGDRGRGDNEYGGKVKAPVSIPGLPPKKNDGRRAEMEDDYDNPPPRARERERERDRGRRDDSWDDRDRGGYEEEDRGRGNANRGKQTRAVSAEEYDELSALCDKLLAQQEQLQNEIKNQANLIKEMQKGGKGGVPPPVLRSKSAVQNKRGVEDVKPPRPGSMPQNNKTPAAAGAAGKKGAPAAELRKAAKVAFGANVIAGDKKPPAPARGGAAAAPSKNAGAAAAKVPPLGAKKPNPAGRAGANTDNRNNGGGGAVRAGGGGGGGGGGLSGFALLQQQVSKKQGPVVVTYEDEGDYDGGRGDLNLELRGQSRYIPVDDDGDQIDQLLNKARRGKFS